MEQFFLRIQLHIIIFTCDAVSPSAVLSTSSKIPSPIKGISAEVDGPAELLVIAVDGLREVDD